MLRRGLGVERVMVIEFTVVGHPKPQPRARATSLKTKGGKTHARVYEPGDANEWKGFVMQAAKPHVPGVPLSGPLRVDLAFRFKRPDHHYRVKNGEQTDTVKSTAPVYASWPGKNDRDNLDKAVLDALTQAGMWRGDGIVCDGRIRKWYVNAGEQPGVTVRIVSL
jgi:Holliday junction resolvase RusA-like endonuclease